jgi:hypothetical protein
MIRQFYDIAMVMLYPGQKVGAVRALRRMGAEAIASVGLIILDVP